MVRRYDKLQKRAQRPESGERLLSSVRFRVQETPQVALLDRSTGPRPTTDDPVCQGLCTAFPCAETCLGAQEYSRSRSS